MPQHKPTRYDPKTRSHYRNLIKAGELIDLIQNSIFETDKSLKMTGSDISAAKLLLNKILPDIKSVEITGEEGKAIKTSLDINFVSRIEPEFIGPPTPGKFINEK